LCLQLLQDQSGQYRQPHDRCGAGEGEAPMDHLAEGVGVVEVRERLVSRLNPEEVA
jgi:hypothetical protein